MESGCIEPLVSDSELVLFLGHKLLNLFDVSASFIPIDQLFQLGVIYHVSVI
jgi:hypothetical protein